MWKAVIPGLITIAPALVFSLMFRHLEDFHMIRPIFPMTEGVRALTHRQMPFEGTVEAKDDLGQLASAIRGLYMKIGSLGAER